MTITLEAPKLSYELWDILIKLIFAWISRYLSKAQELFDIFQNVIIL